MLLVLLHGYEDDPAGLEGLAADLAPSATVVAPRGPHELPGGPSWLPSDDADPAAVATTLDHLDAVVAAAVAEHGATHDDVVVGGFSQGGAAALAHALRTGDRPLVGGCFVWCGFLWPPPAVDYDLGRAAGRPFLVVHGADDQAVPVQQGRSTARVLERHGAEVRYCEHPDAGHALDPRYVSDTRGWLHGLADRAVRMER